MSIFDTLGNFFLGGPATSNTTGTLNSTTTKTPYGPTVGPLNDYLASTQALYGGGAPQISPYEQSGYNALASTAASSPDLSAASAENQKTISGAYLTPETNPYLADIAKQVSGTTMANINSTFGGQGRTGSGLNAYEAGKGVSDSLTGLYGNEYNQERGLQQQAVSQAPTLDASRYLGPASLINAGQAISARPYDINAQYGGILGNIAQLGGTQNTNATQTSNTTSRAQSNGYFLNKLFPS